MSHVINTIIMSPVSYSKPVHYSITLLNIHAYLNNVILSGDLKSFLLEYYF